MSYLHKPKRLKSVGLVGDGDDVELITSFESTFGISFSQDELQNLVTLDDAHKIICAKLPNNQSQQKKCLTAMAYYRLNRALLDEGKSKLETHIAVPDGQNPRQFQRRLEQKAQLKLDFLTKPSRWVTSLFVLQFIGFFVAMIILHGWAGIFGGFLAATIFHFLWRYATILDNRVWVFEGTLADLSRRASEANIGNLVALGGRWKEADIWKVMTSLVNETTGFPQEKMTPDMKFI